MSFMSTSFYESSHCQFPKNKRSIFKVNKHDSLQQYINLTNMQTTNAHDVKKKKHDNSNRTAFQNPPEEGFFFFYLRYNINHYKCKVASISYNKTAWCVWFGLQPSQAFDVSLWMPGPCAALCLQSDKQRQLQRVRLAHSNSLQIQV